MEIFLFCEHKQKKNNKKEFAFVCPSHTSLFSLSQGQCSVIKKKKNNDLPPSPPCPGGHITIYVLRYV